eukprot:scaffold85325_cov30-Tisochrysis_lutea.AAC.2
MTCRWRRGKSCGLCMMTSRHQGVGPRLPAHSRVSGLWLPMHDGHGRVWWAVARWGAAPR